MRALVLALALVVGMTGCRAGEVRDQQVQVLAAASLTEAFSALEGAFEREWPDVDIVLVTGSSTELAEQASDGAPGHVLATADAESMRIAVTAGAVAGTPRGFVSNRLVMVTGPGNPHGIATLGDLSGTEWVRCADAIPCGRLAASALAEAGVSDEPVSLEPDVRATLERVASGEAEAGLVYASDARSAGDAVETVELPQDHATTYEIAALEAGGRLELADEWIAFVLSDEGLAVLHEHGFGPAS